MDIEHTPNDKASSNCMIMVVIASALVFAPTAMTLLYFNPSLAAAQSSNQSKQASTTNSSSTYLKKLGKNLGSNSRIIANNTSIGNPHAFQNFAKEHKITASTPKSVQALPLHPQLRNMTSTAASAGGGGNKTAGNMTSAAASSTNSTKK